MKQLASVMLAIASLLATPASGAAPPAGSTVDIGIITGVDRPQPPLSPLDAVAGDEALQGARLAISDNATTGRFTGQKFRLIEETLSDITGIGHAARRFEHDGVRFIVSDLRIEPLTALLDAASPATVVVNTRAPDDRLRNEGCRPSLLHVAPSRAMQADALAQYLVVRRWVRWALIIGRREGDALYAEAVRQSAKRFGARIVEEKKWTFEVGNPHADSGHVTLQSEIPRFTRATEHDVMIVADESDEFGDELPYRTWSPRPVAGTQGLIATAWSPVQEQWGALQLQSRFERQAHRRMALRDYTAWLAVRAIGEAAIRTHSADAETIRRFMQGPDFRLGGFKGQPMSFRPWDNQLRQPMLIAGPRVLVSVSPQPEFLHEGSPLDSLGPDATETRCKLP
jgi:ABC transporter substrate binding protein (PQQ-dependent alcohol dehydrogenase system)